MILVLPIAHRDVALYIKIYRNEVEIDRSHSFNLPSCSSEDKQHQKRRSWSRASDSLREHSCLGDAQKETQLVLSQVMSL